MIAIPYSGDLTRELATALEAGEHAASVILEYYNAQSAETYVKGDGSPVTDADLASDRAIREIISREFPDDALLTEEGAKEVGRLDYRRCWIVDPIDGTAQFVGRTGQFDVMIALAIDGRPAVAVAMQPTTGLVHAAVAGAGAWEARDGSVSPFRIQPAAMPPRLVTSKWYGGLEPGRSAAVRAIAARLGAEPPVSIEVGYQSRAFSEASRTYDAFVGLPQDDKGSIAQEWDFACVDLITHEAGGRFTDCWGRLHRYNKRSTNVSGGILASSDPVLHERLLEAIAVELPPDVPAPDPADDDVPTRAG